MTERPLTAHDLADALGCFSNAAIGAMHNGTHVIGCVAQGIEAVMWRLQEIAEEQEKLPAEKPASFFTTKEWFGFPLELRQRWWVETDYGKRPPPGGLVAELAAHKEAKT